MPISDWPVGMEVVVLRYNINNAANRVLHTTIAKVGRTLVTTAAAAAVLGLAHGLPSTQRGHRA
jgi:hypothetical protein